MKKSVLLIALFFLGIAVYAQDNNVRRPNNGARPARTMRKAFSPEEMAEVAAAIAANI